MIKITLPFFSIIVLLKINYYNLAMVILKVKYRCEKMHEQEAKFYLHDNDKITYPKKLPCNACYNWAFPISKEIKHKGEKVEMDY